MRHRTTITLTDEQYERLREEAERCGKGVPELVRLAVERVYSTRRSSREEMQKAFDESFGLWKDRDFDGESYVERMRTGLARRG